MEDNGIWKPYKVVSENFFAEITEKKSRFLAQLSPAETEEEAMAVLAAQRKKYWDASHHCHAFILGRDGGIVRCSDDGEPGGTAGKPILEVLQGEEIRNAVLVVTRYFGGTLLGTGGLVRAYSGAARAVLKAALEAAGLGRMQYGKKLLLTCDYNDIGKIQYYLAQEKYLPADSEYAQQIRMTVQVPGLAADVLCRSLKEMTAGRIGIEELESGFFVDKRDMV